ncbi:hypothetical protein ACFL9T_10745 [Thermodesulfobacteriota bacterium]
MSEINSLGISSPKLGLKKEGSFGIPDEYLEETIKSFIVLKPGETNDPEEIIAFSREKIAPCKAPKHVEFRNILPKSTVEKF